MFRGWDNWTNFEKEQIALLKQTMLERHGIDLDKAKQFGPRIENGVVTEGSSQIINGRDAFLQDSDLLKYLVCRNWNIDLICNDLLYHLEWRQTNVPIPLLTDRSLQILKHGLIYIHGRAKDGSPIMVLNLQKLQQMLESKAIDAGSFCNLYNFFSAYVQRNMLVPGQVERALTICNVNQFPLGELSSNMSMLGMFSTCARELQCNYLETQARQFIVNLTWVQKAVANML